MDIGTGIVNENAGLHIPVGIDMTIVFTPGNTAADKLPVILKIHQENRFSPLKGPHLPNSVIHIFPLLRCRKQFRRRIISHRHIVEEPGKGNALFYKEIQKRIDAQFRKKDTVYEIRYSVKSVRSLNNAKDDQSLS